MRWTSRSGWSAPQDVPDHSVIARFRQAHQKAFADVFVQVLRLAAKAGLGRFGTIAIDGTKIAANASVDANRTEAWLRGQVEAIVAEAQRVDAAEDAEYGERRGDEPPDDFADPDARAEKIRAALAEIEAERAAAEQRPHRDCRAEAGRGRRRPHTARAAAGRGGAGHGAGPAGTADRRPAGQDRRPRGPGRGRAGRRERLPAGRAPAPVEEHSAIRAARASAGRRRGAGRRTCRPGGQAARRRRGRICTDPGSRLMPTRRGWIQGYNVQVAATDDQLIVATRVGQQTGDRRELVPMMAAAQAAADDCASASGRTDLGIETVLADAGYASEANLTAPGPDRLIAVGQGRPPAQRRPPAARRRRPAAGRQPARGDGPPAAHRRGRSPLQTARGHR